MSRGGKEGRIFICHYGDFPISPLHEERTLNSPLSPYAFPFVDCSSLVSKTLISSRWLRQIS